MDSQYVFASKEDIWRLQSDLKSVYAVQAEQAERLQRLERRYEEDNRVKSVWGNTPTFSSARGGTPHQDAGYNPAAEAFKNFDQDHSTSLLGSLHIDTEDEPRRGASRANSVRFDESALHGQLTHTSRSSSEFFPVRTGSGFGSHPLTERSSSHKSEGRQSSTGVSTTSTGLNGLGFDQQTQNALVDLSSRPAPGLLLLGPHPSIIRCWLGSKFTNDTLRYVAVSTGASHSAIARSWLQDIGVQDQIYREDQHARIKLQISLPEATVQPTGSNSPSTRLPTITAGLLVFDVLAEEGTIQCFLGSDVLRARNADILFSQDRLTLYDDMQNKLSVPLVRPEHATTYEQLKTTNVPARVEWRNPVGQYMEPRATTESAEGASPVPGSVRTKASYSRVDWSRVRQAKPTSPSESGYISPAVRDGDSDAIANVNANGKRDQSQEPGLKTPAESEIAVASPVANTPLETPSSETWSWRKDSSGRDGRKELTFSTVASSSGQKTPSQGKGMKVLKARRMSSNRSISTTEAPRLDTSSSIWSTASPADPTSAGDGAFPHSADSQRRTYSSDLKSALTGGSNGNRPSNPIGGASAFGWLNPAQGR